MNIPASIVAVCVSKYWSTVAVKALKFKRNFGKQPNVIPREPIGLALRVLWLPVVMAWVYLPWRYAYLVPHQVPSTLERQFIGFLAALMAIAALYLSFYCWREMGKSWRIGIDPNDKTPLVTTGPYRWSSHPIYSLSMLLAMSTLMAVPTMLMLVVVALHITLLVQEALREEKDLMDKHGQQYALYRQQVGRFLPRWQ